MPQHVPKNYFIRLFHSEVPLFYFIFCFIYSHLLGVNVRFIHEPSNCHPFVLIINVTVKRSEHLNTYCTWLTKRCVHSKNQPWVTLISLFSMHLMMIMNKISLWEILKIWRQVVHAQSAAKQVYQCNIIDNGIICDL